MKVPISKIPAGHNLDLLVHQHVMGKPVMSQAEMQAEAEQVWAKQPECERFCAGFYVTVIDDKQVFRQNVPAYSSDMSAAWRVVEVLRNDKWFVTLKLAPPNTGFIIEGFRSEYDTPCQDREVCKGGICCELEDHTTAGGIVNCRPRQSCIARSAALAICRAALHAVGVHEIEG